MMIDFRCRPPYKSYLEAIMYREIERSEKISRKIGMEQAESVKNRDIKLTMDEMREAGIAKGVVSGRKANKNIGIVDNEDIAELVRTYPEYFIGLAGIDPLQREKAIDEIERYVVKGELKGVVVEPGVLDKPLYADDKQIYDVYDFCQERNIPVMLMIGSTVGPDLSYTMPMQIDNVAREFPKMKLIIAHGGWPWVTEFCQIAYKRKNVYLLPDMYMLNMPGFEGYITAANYALKEQMLFGSAYPFVPMKDAVECIKKNGLREEVYDKFFYENALEVLNLDGQ